MLSIKEFAINPLSPNTCSPHYSSYIPYGTTGENYFVLTSQQFITGDHFIHSHDLSV